MRKLPLKPRPKTLGITNEAACGTWPNCVLRFD